jgi:nucleoside-diphosphate-sugar epimerase
MKKKKKILIIGHSGLVGNSLFSILKRNESFFIKGISSKEINLLKKNSIKKLKKLNFFDVIIFCSAIKSDFGNNFKNLEQNIILINNLINGIDVDKIEKFIYLSSNAVYGVHTGHKKVKENSRLISDTPYSLSKYYSEKILELKFKDHKKKLVILRPTTIFGSKEKILAGNPYGFLIKMMRRNIIKVWGKGEEKREFLFVNDLSKIILQVIKKDFFGILNVGGFRSSYINIIKKISKKFQIKEKIIFQKRTTKKVDKSYNSNLLKKLYPNFKYTNLDKYLKKIKENFDEL